MFYSYLGMNIIKQYLFKQLHRSLFLGGMKGMWKKGEFKEAMDLLQKDIELTRKREERRA